MPPLYSTPAPPPPDPPKGTETDRELGVPFSAVLGADELSEELPPASPDPTDTAEAVLLDSVALEDIGSKTTPEGNAADGTAGGGKDDADGGSSEPPPKTAHALGGSVS